MKNFRKTYTAKFIIWLMIFSITLISCDPQGKAVSNHLADKQIDKQIEAMARSYTAEECEQAKNLLIRAKNYVLARSEIGRVNRADVMNYMIDQSILDGDLVNLTQEQREQLVDAFEENAFYVSNESLDAVYDNMNYEGKISISETDFLKTFEDQLWDLTTETEVIAAFDATRADLNANPGLSDLFKEGMHQGLNHAELVMCAQNEMGNVVGEQKSTDRCSIKVCVTEYRWVIQLIMVVIAVVALILGFFTLGFTWVLTAIVVSSMILIPVIVCSLIPCPPPPSECPPGQTLVCMPGFTLNADNLCFAAGFSFIGRGLFSAGDASGCPPGSFDTGATGPGRCAFGPIDDLDGGIFSDLQSGTGFWADQTGAFHTPVCN